MSASLIVATPVFASNPVVTLEYKSGACATALSRFATIEGLKVELLNVECIVAPCPAIGIGKIEAANAQQIASKLKLFLQGDPTTSGCGPMVRIQEKAG